MRIPSSGQSFKIGEIKFEVIKSMGVRIKAKGRFEEKPEFRKGASFRLLGTKFVLRTVDFKDNIIKIEAAGVSSE